MLRVFVLASSVWLVVSGVNNGTKVDKAPDNKQTLQSTPVSVDSRFFDLGQLFKPFSNFNQNWPAGNTGTNLPQNSQFSPTQGNFQQRPISGDQWGQQGNIRPGQNQGFNPQQPSGGQWQNPQFSNGGPNYPGGANNNQMQRPNQYPGNNQNPSNWRPDSNSQGANQFGSNGLNTQIQMPTDQGQGWNQPRPIPDPDQNRPTFPGQGFQRPPISGVVNYPNDNNQGMYPGNEFQGSDFNSNQWNPNSGSGTVDDIPPQMYNGSGNNAILGKPVIIPTSTVNPHQITFDNSSESPLQRQCVQDCPATPEYNPICGTNNVTYFNPGKFVCARNCGVSVYVARRGVCQPRPRRMISISKIYLGPL